MNKSELVFHPASEKPVKPSTGSTGLGYLLYNRCDGFHVVSAIWFEDGEFCAFQGFMGRPWLDGDYNAWAELPDCNVEAYEKFVKGIGK